MATNLRASACPREDLVSLGEPLAIRLEPRIVRDGDPHTLEPLEPVLEHRPVRLAPDIQPEVHEEIRAETQDVAIEGRMVEACRVRRHWRRWVPRAGHRPAGCGPPPAAPGVEAGRSRIAPDTPAAPAAERLLVQPPLGDHGHVCPPGLHAPAVLAGRRQRVLLVVYRDEEAQGRGLVADDVYGPDRRVLAGTTPNR
jgi:hypothetical protein